MQLIKAEQKYSRQSPRKVRLSADAIRGLSVEKAIEQLSVLETKGSVVIMKVLRQAIANATNNLGLKVADLELKEITVNHGPVYKRFRAASRGRSSTILKPTCHVRIVLKSTVESAVSHDKAAKKSEQKQAEVKVTAKNEAPEVQSNLVESKAAVANMKAVKQVKPVNTAPNKVIINRTTSK